MEIRFCKSKWLLFGTYHPPSQDDKLYFNSIGQGLDVYTKSYDKFLLIGDFNAEEGEADMENFMELYDLGGVGKTEIILVEGDEIAQDDSEVANILGDFFSNSVRGLNIEIPSEYKNEVSPLPIDKIIATYSDHPSIKLTNDNVVKGTFSFEEVSVATIRKQIMSLDDTKTSMSSSIPPKILKENIDIFCNPLTAIINSGISNSSFNKGLADVIPVHKTDVTTDKKNYRNVSLLPVVSKIFEKMMQTQFSGYRKGDSAQHALICMLEKWRTSLDKGGYGGGMLMDLSKAFDTLDHDLLKACLCLWFW